MKTIVIHARRTRWEMVRSPFVVACTTIGFGLTPHVVCRLSLGLTLLTLSL